MINQYDKEWKYRKYKISTNNFRIISPKPIKEDEFVKINVVQNINTKEKFVSKSIFSNKTPKKEIYREIEIMTQFDLPMFVEFAGFSLKDFDNQNNITIFTKLTKNGSLEKLLQNASLGLAPIEFNNTIKQNILIGIAYSMYFLNVHHIIHRDLKPGNIFIDESFHPRLGDFGLSKSFQIGEEFNQSKSCGTPIYMAPENDEKMNYGMKSDVYSFGLILYEMITGETPYKEFLNDNVKYENYVKTDKKNDFQPKFGDSIKISFKNLILKCLSKNPNDRPTFEEIFNKLAYNFDDDNEEENYFLDGVIKEQIDDYVELITKRKKKDEVNSKFLIEKLAKIEKENYQAIKNFNQQMNQLTQELKKLKNDNDILNSQLKNCHEKIGEILKSGTVIKENQILISSKIYENEEKNKKLINFNQQIENQVNKNKQNVKAIITKLTELNEKINQNFEYTDKKCNENDSKINNLTISCQFMKQDIQTNKNEYDEKLKNLTYNSNYLINEFNTFRVKINSNYFALARILKSKQSIDIKLSDNEKALLENQEMDFQFSRIKNDIFNLNNSTREMRILLRNTANDLENKENKNGEEIQKLLGNLKKFDSSMNKYQSKQNDQIKQNDITNKKIIQLENSNHEFERQINQIKQKLDEIQSKQYDSYEKSEIKETNKNDAKNETKKKDTKNIKVKNVKKEKQKPGFKY